MNQAQKQLDKDMLIRLIIEQEPTRMDVLEALQNAPGGRWEPGEAYFCFAEPNTDPPLPISETLTLDHPDYLFVGIDLLEDGSVWGVELLGWEN